MVYYPSHPIFHLIFDLGGKMQQGITAAIFSCSGPKLTDAEKRFFNRVNPVGVNLFARNITSKEQVKTLIHDIKEAIARDDVLIAIDQEGGRVRRLREPDFRSYAAAITLGSLPSAVQERAAFLQALLISADFQNIGANLNYAPVLDTLYPQTSPVLKSRCFSSETETIIHLGKTMVQEYQKNGICPCIKHLPGHGRAEVDPHLNLPILHNSLTDLAKDFAPFQKLKDAPSGMSAHIILSAIDANNPITVSPKGIKEVIRGIIGFKGFLISDAIDMHALKGSKQERTLAALHAGCDCICYTLGQIDEMEQIAEVCPTLPPAAEEKLQQIKHITTKKINFANLKEYAKEYNQIIGLVEPYRDDYDATETLNKMQQKEI